MENITCIVLHLNSLTIKTKKIESMNLFLLFYTFLEIKRT